jgi:NAD+ synthase
MTREPRDADHLIETLVGWLEERASAAGTRGFVFGLSGGIDSAVVCGLAARALAPEASLGVIMPIGNVAEDEELGREVARVFGVREIQPDLLPAFDALQGALSAERDAAGLQPVGPEAALLASANLKPRLRMLTLYHYANLLDYLVLGTGNRAEITVGYFTKHGDSGVDLLPLADLTKGEVRAVAAALGVPARIIERPPSAGLWEGQTDEAEMGLTYAQIDAYLLTGTSGDQGADAEISRRFDVTRHKREFPPTPSLP